MMKARFHFVSVMIVATLAWAQQPVAPLAADPQLQAMPARGQVPNQMLDPASGQPQNPQTFPENPSAMPMMDTPRSTPDIIGMRPVEGLSARDPFRLPEELIIKIRQKNANSNVGGLDPSVQAIRRYPLANYNLVGIIWDVKNPKAMFMDRDKAIHMVRVNDFIGNAKGVVVSIQSGAVTVLEGKIPQIIKLAK